MRKWILSIGAAIALAMGGITFAFAYGQNPGNTPAGPLHYFCVRDGSVSPAPSPSVTPTPWARPIGRGYIEVHNVPHPCPSGYELTQTEVQADPGQTP